MELRHLRSFLAVAREQSISGAARVLHITQPSLSRQIMDLEEEMGARLFERGSRKITLTAQGLLLRKRAGQIMELVQKTQEEVSAPEELDGVIRIGAGETRAFSTLAVVLNGLTAEHPSVRHELFSGNADDVMERLDKGLLDFGVFIEPHDVTRYDYLRLPHADRWGVLMRRDSPLAERSSVRPEDLRDVPLTVSRQSLEGGQLASWLAAVPGEPRLAGSYNLLFNAALMAESGAGCVLCLEGIVRITEDGPLRFRPLEPALTSHVDLVWNKNQLFSKPSELFLSRVRAAIGAGTL
ncbi:MAG: LysR family transcriptional regulator [Desulfovibrionaceae bacterium]|nr:LysR family transcriptional regulator [Desulfovibrionaceae bacterium]